MKMTTRNTRSPGAWILGGVASLLMCVSAFGQYTVTQNSPITINDAAPGSPYPSSIYLTNANLLGTLEKVSVTVNNLSHPYAPDIGILLVGPNGRAVVLMSGSGGNPSGSAALDKATLIFTDDATASLPVSSPLVSGSSYKPTDNANLSFPSPAPGTGYAATLGAAFGGSNPNGVWSLYVLDDLSGPTTSITPMLGSWTLNLFTTPLVSTSTNTVYLAENGNATSVNFTIQDSSPPASGYTVTAGNSATNLVSAVATVNGSAGTVTLTPLNNAFGTNTLTLTVSDGVGTVQTNITVNLAHVNQAPTLTITNATLTTVAGTLSPVVNVVVSDVDPNNAPSSLTLSVSSSDTNLVAPAGVFFSTADTGALRKFAIVPVGTNTGTATLTFTVTDPGSLSNSTTINVTVQPVSHPVIASTKVLGLSSSGTTNSSIAVSNISGLIGNVSVAVAGLQSVAPNNLQLALVAPGGTVTLLNNSATAGPNTFAQANFSAGSGSAGLPSSDSITPVGIQASGLSSLVGSNPNGTWSLWATNGGTGAQITGGWVLNLFVAPTISSTVTNISMPEETSTNIAFSVASIDGTITNASDVTIVSGNTDLLTVVNPTFDTGTLKGAATLQAIFKDTGPQYGATTVTVTVKDNNNFTATFVYNVTVNFVNHAPVISFIPRQVTRVGDVLGPVSFSVTDPDLPPQTLSATATSDNQALIPDSNILIQGSGNSFSFTVFPLGIVAGSANITIVATDGITKSTTIFPVDVQSQGNPLFASQKQISLPANAVSAPYPSQIGVSNLVGTISAVSVTLFDVTQSFPDNMNALLVSPQGTRVLLMGHAGGGNAINNTTLVLDDAAANPLPDSGQIVSGTYQPSAYGTDVTFPVPAPAGPYQHALSAFNGLNGTNANGLWSLYVTNDGSGKGVILSGWALSIQTLPSVQPIADLTLRENDQTQQVSVNVGDDQPGVNITVTATSANPNVVRVAPEAGSGGTRIIDVTPVPYQTGSNILVTVTASTGSSSSSGTFHVTVYPIDLPPVVSAIAPLSTPAGSPSPTSTFTVWDPQDSAITITPGSSDTRLIPNSNIKVTGPTSVGTTNSHTLYQYGLSFTPADTNTGSAVISVAVSDAAGQRTTSNVTATVTYYPLFGNFAPITIPDGYPIASNASPYPSTISVSGLSGVVTGARVTLQGFTHQFPEDVNVLLVSPDNSKSVILMAQAGDGTPANDLTLTFDDAASSLPSGSALSSGTYAPSSFAAGLTFAAPAPTSGYRTNLASLAGTSPNGDWKLYVMDNNYPYNGSIGRGWMLALQTGPAFDLTTLGPQTTLENTPAVVRFNVLDNSMDPSTLVVTATTNGPFTPTNLLNLVANLQVTNNGGSTRTLIITPSPNLPSTFTNINATTTITLTVTDTNNNTSQTSFPLTVVYSNQPPVVATATNSVRFPENTSTTISYTLSDVDSTLYTSNLVVTSTDPNLVPNSTNNLVVTISTNRVVPGASATVTVKVIPPTYSYGTNTLTVAIGDGIATTTNTVTLNVEHVLQAPVITGLPSPYNVPAGSATPAIPFTVTSPEGITALTVTATSGNQALVPNVNIILSGSGANRTIQLIPVGTISGSVTITLLAGDGTRTNTVPWQANFTAPPVSLFGNGQVVSVKGSTNAVNGSPYPISFNVTNLIGGIYNVSLEMRGFSNSAPAQFDALLVSPDGIAVVLMSGAGGTAPVNGLDVTFDDSGATLADVGPLTSGTYHPAYYTKRLLPAPAPQTGYQARLSAFGASTSVNGIWQLYVNSQTPGNFGQIAGGVYLTIVPKPVIQVTSATPVAIPQNGSGVINFTVDDSTTATTNLTVTATSDNRALLPATPPYVVVTALAPGTNNTFSATLNPVDFVNGSANLTLTATRADGATTSLAVPVTVGATNFPPTISRLLPQTTAENQPFTIEFLVSDVDTALSNLTVKAVSDTQGVIGDSNLVFVASGSNIVKGLPASSVPQVSTLDLTVKPNSFTIGSANISIIVTDTTTNGVNTVSSNFLVTVSNVVYPPILSKVPDQTLTAGSNILIGFTVTSLNQGSPTLAVTATSSDQTLVKNSNLLISPASASGTPNRTLQITAEQNAKGSVGITLTATDTSNGNVSSSTNFNLVVLSTPAHTYSNPGLIVINDNAAANPYPSTISVPNLQGKISAVTVTLNGFTHRYPSDVGVLLTGPVNGQAIDLMDKAGGGTSVTNLNITFNQAASAAIPQGAAITNGSYKPASYNSSTYNYPSPAPVHPYSVDLTSLNGAVPNGTWSIYVVDQSPPDSGAISNGWALTITTTPVITLYTNNLFVNENETNAQPFTIGDDSPSGPSYRFGVSSTNTTLVPDANVTFAGSGTNYTVTITPALYKFGTNLVTIYATNIDNMVASSTFLVTVPQKIFAPNIATIPNTNVAAGAVAYVPLSYSDIQIPTDQLKVTFSSSNPTLVPVDHMLLSGGTLQISPAGALSGSSVITVTVTQPGPTPYTLSTTTNFTLTVTPTQNLFGNVGTIVINDRAPASPYPSTINVSNVAGNIVKATVSVRGLAHTYPSDISMLLVGPQGQKVVLMSRAGAGVGSSITNVNLTFDDTASSGLVQSGVITSGSYKPSDYNNALAFYPNAPAGPYVTNLSAFNGTSPNGTWSLWIQDDLSPDSGIITGDWLVNFVTTAPMISSVGPQTTPENTTNIVQFTVSSALLSADKITVTPSSSGATPAGLVASLTVTGPGTNAAGSRTLTIVPGANLPSAVTTADGTATITLTATDGTNSSSISFPLTVTFVNQAPTISGLSDKTTPANAPLAIAFTVNDVDTPASNLTVTASSSVAAVGRIALATNGNAQILTFTPNGTVGATVITVVADDSQLKVTNTFNITVTGAVPPVIGAIANTNTMANVPAVVGFNVTYPVGSITNLSFSATADATIVSGVVFTNVSDQVEVAIINLMKNATGTTQVIITASDGITNGSQSFELEVEPPTPPVIGAIDPVSRPANQVITISIPVTSPVTPISNLGFTASSSSQTLVRDDQMHFANDGVKVSLTISPQLNQTGQAIISVFANDGFSTVSNAFSLTVTLPAMATLGPISPQTNAANTAVVIPLAVNSPDTAITNLVFTGTSTNSALVSAITFTNNATTEVATIRLAPNKTGDDYVTIAVSDVFGQTSTTSFTLHVTPITGPTLTASVKNGQLTITVAGAPNATYGFQTTADFKTWTDSGQSVTADASGNATATIPMPAAQHQFTRAYVK